MSKEYSTTVSAISFHNVVPAEVQTLIRDHGWFSTVRIEIGATAVTMFTSTIQEANDIVALLGNPTLEVVEPNEELYPSPLQDEAME